MNKVIYDRHAEAWEKVLKESGRHAIGESWIDNKKTLDKWRHFRMYKLLSPLMSLIELSWLTVGDGRYGTDAIALKRMGVKHIHCSDISDTLLKIAAKNGLIDKFSEQNAESMSFKDEQFDFVLCKEAYHHFPRPHLALHEMLRVCKIGVVLIEPRHFRIDTPPLYFLVRFAKWCLRRSKNSHHRFEEIGNYICSVSEKELEKFQLSMHRRYIAINGINDVYEKGGEFINLDSKLSGEQKIIKKVRRKIWILNLLCKFGFYKTNLVTSILFKGKPSSKILKALSNSGWRIDILPENPYLFRNES